MDRRGTGGGGGRVWRGMLPVLALHAVSEYSRLDRKPPVTAGLIAANTLVYLRPNFLHTIIPTIDEVWFNPYLILKVSRSILLSFTFTSRILYFREQLISSN